MARRQIGEILREQGLLTDAQLQEALALQQKTPSVHLAQILVEKGFVRESDAAKALALQLDLPYKNVSSVTVPPEVLAHVPQDFAQRHKVLPLSQQGNTLALAMVDPLNLSVIQDVEFRSGFRVSTVVGADSEILRGILRNYAAQDYDFLHEVPVEASVEVINVVSIEEDEEKLLKTAEAVPVVRLVNMVFANAAKLRASDIHLEPAEHELHVRCRVDGMLRDILKVPKHIQESVVSRIKILSKMDIAERRRPQDGRIKVRFQGREFDMRVSTLPTLYGEKVVIRMLDKSRGLLTLSDLGLSAENLRVMHFLLSQPQGMVLVTGPTGSGKTTTLYASLNWLKSETKNIVTVEDPIEYEVAGVNQVQVNEKAGVTFASGLRSILRQDPNVVLVGEIRDKETAEIAFQASLTGHLVLSTLHTNDAPSTITRLVDLGVKPFLIASSVIGIIAQRLVRQICPQCREPYTPEVETLSRLNLLGTPAASRTYSLGRGCEACDQEGYLGRVAIYQILRADDAIRAVISETTSESEIARLARAAGMKNLAEDGVEKAGAGVTTLEEVLRVAPAVEAPTAPPPSPAGVGERPREEGRPAPAPVAPSGIRREKVLVVDDSQTIVDMVKLFLEKEQYEVITAKDGMEALERIYQEIPDLILTDVMMPRLDGMGLCKKLKERVATSTIPIIMLTAKGEADSEIQGLEAGADDYIAKPIDPKRLLTRVKALLRRSQQRR